MRVLLIALVLALALVGAGCGGDDDEASSETDTSIIDTVTDETTTDEETTDEETTTAEDDETVGDSLDSAACQELVAASQAFAAAFTAAESGSDEELEQSVDAFNRFADEAPEEIREDLQTLAEGYAAYIQAIQDIGIDPGGTPSAEQVAELQAALAPLSEPEFTEASQRFSEWSAANC